jgi:hypothetical protein
MKEIDEEISSDEEVVTARRDGESKKNDRLFGPSDGEKAVRLDQIRAMQKKI